MIDKRQYSCNRDYNEKYIQPTIKKVKERSFSDYLDWSIIIMIIGLFVAIGFAFFIEFIFDASIDWKEIGVNTVVVAACTIAIYLLLRKYSMRKGRKCKDWIAAEARMREKGREIISNDRAQFISEYCREWEAERLKNDIEDVLAPVGIEYTDFLEYAKYDKKELKDKYTELTKYQFKVIERAKKIKRLHFDERYFYVNSESDRHRRSPSGGITTKKVNRFETARIILTTLLTSFLTAALLKDIILDFSLASIIKCVVKIATIIFFGALGLIGGYSFTAVKETSEMNAKSDEIEVFMKWCEKKEEE